MKTFYKFLLLTLTPCMPLLTGNAYAQQAARIGTVTGSVKDEANKPLDYASVTLLKAQDSTLVKTALTDASGHYSFDNLAANSYIVGARVVGYKKAYTKPFLLDQNTGKINVAELQLQPEAKTLQAVTVTGTKPLIEQRADKMVMNVAGSIVAAGNNALDVLEKAPGVTIDKDDNISLKGKQGVTVMINGKQTYLSASQLAALLRATDGNTIESVEIITNPSAKYDAAGNSGIINIKLKKNKASGTNGNLALGAGYGEYYKSNGSLNINHKSGDWNLFGNFSYSNDKRGTNIGISRNILNDGVTTNFNQLSKMASGRENSNFKAGVDYNTSKRNSLGAVVTGLIFNGDDGNTNNTVVSQLSAANYRINTITNADFRNNNFSLNLNDRFEIDTNGRELSADVDYSKFNNKSNTLYDNYYFNGDGSSSGPALYLRNILPSEIDIKSAKLDYTHPFSKSLKMETGLKVSSVKTDNNLQFDSLQANQWTNDPRRSNHFIYQENIYAGYLNLSQSFKKLTLQVGVRAEQTHSDGNSLTENKEVKRNYLDLFPSVFVTEQLGKNHSLGINYSKRIDRPSYEDLNPFAYYLDPYTYVKGNSFLNPQYTHSLELSYTFKKRYIATLAYSITNDVMAEVMLQDNASNVTYVTQMNLDKQKYYALSLNIPVQFTKWWSSNNNINNFYLGFNSNLLGAQLDNGRIVTQIYSNHSFTITPTLRAEVSANYTSPLNYSVYHVGANWGVDPGISKSFANKRANLKFSVSDIFNTRNRLVTSRYQNLDVVVDQKRENRIGRLTFTYNFGNTKLQIKKHEAGAQEEKSRVKSGN